MANRRFPQKITWWAGGISDGYGGETFGNPVLIKGRWEDKQTLFRNRNGDEIMSAAIAYLDRDVTIGDYLILGDQTGTMDPTLLEAFEIKQFSKTPDIRILNNERKVYM